MAACAYCGSSILFGGKKEGEYRFCNAKCLEKGRVIMVANDVPDDLVNRYVRDTHTGVCPKCKKQRGKIDVYTSYSVWSAVVLTSWSSASQISCRGCGRKAMVLGAISSFLLGWWGLPLGIIITPVQIGRNIWGLLRADESTIPSDALKRMVRRNLAAYALAQDSQLNQTNDSNDANSANKWAE